MQKIFSIAFSDFEIQSLRKKKLHFNLILRLRDSEIFHGI